MGYVGGGVDVHLGVRIRTSEQSPNRKVADQSRFSPNPIVPASLMDLDVCFSW